MKVQTQVERYAGDGTIYIDPAARVVRVTIVAPTTVACRVFLSAPGVVTGGVQLSKLGYWSDPITLETAGPGGALLVRDEKIIFQCGVGGYLLVLLDVLVGE